MNRQIEEAIRLDKMTRVGAGRGVVNPEFVVPERTKVKPLTPLSKEKAKEEKDNAKEIASAYEQIADEIFKLVNGERELAIFQFARKGATVEEIAAYTERLDKLAQLKDAQKATEEEAKQYADQDKLNRQARNDLLDKAKQLYDETRTPLEKLNIAEAELLRLLELGVIDFDVYSRAVIQANEALDKMAEDGKNNFADLEAAIRGWGNEFTNIMANAVMTGKLSFKDLANSVISDLLRMSIQAQITKPLMNLGMDFLGIKVSGARAMGGPVTSNQPYLVGENGPEIFMPNNSGTIIPNGQGGSVVVQQTINVTTGVQQTVRAEVMNMLPQIANAAKSAVAEAKLRGGSFAAAMR
jgi:lambda family phage tail tape measure protein